MSAPAVAPNRLLFGSDWPVCTLAAFYDRVVGVLGEVLGARLDDTFERKLFGENAERFHAIAR
jgi:L-fuconolactonase